MKRPTSAPSLNALSGVRLSKKGVIQYFPEWIPCGGMQGLQSLIWIGDAGSESGMTELLINDNLERPFWKDSGAQIKKPPS